MKGYVAYPILKTMFLLFFNASSIHSLKARLKIW